VGGGNVAWVWCPCLGALPSTTNSRRPVGLVHLIFDAIEEGRLVVAMGGGIIFMLPLYNPVFIPVIHYRAQTVEV
jgi:hypothetical protein